MTESNNTHIVIIGGGAAGITVAASLMKRAKNITIDIIDPSDNHYYQPAFTLVGAGAYNLSDTRRDMASLIPSGVNWTKEAVNSFDPEKNTVTLKSGDILSYDYLVVCPGLKLDWDKVKGLKEAVGKEGVCTNYSEHHAEYTWECIQNLQKGQKALFTQPAMPFKCPGAPQKIAYLAADYLKKKNILDDCDLHFMTQTPGVFGVPFFAKELVKIMDRYGIKKHLKTNLVQIDGENKVATFKDEEGNDHKFDYDMIHVTPPQGPHDFMIGSPLVNDAGWVDVHQNSMQHTKYSNVFSLGDACSTPNSKTAAAVRKQAPVVVKNLINMMTGKSLVEDYDGYASCPLTTSYGKVMMAEFTYGGKVTPTFPLDPAKEHSSYWWIKKTGLPIMYWKYMLKGHEWFFGHNKSFIEK